MDNNQEYYGAPTSSEIKPLGERLRDHYEPSDFVTVINIDTEPLRYQFMNPAHEQFVQTAPYNGETYHTQPPTVVTLQPGETKLCPAFEADMMITTLIKKLTQRRTDQKITAGQLRVGASADWNDPTTQIGLIGKILLGKEDLVGKYNASLKAPAVTNDLELDDEPVERPKRGRPSRAVEAA